jgi:hypothetical protein
MGLDGSRTTLVARFPKLSVVSGRGLINYWAAAPPLNPQGIRIFSCTQLRQLESSLNLTRRPTSVVFCDFNFTSSLAEGADIFQKSPVHDSYSIFKENVQFYRRFTSVSTRDTDSVLSRHNRNRKQRRLHLLRPSARTKQIEHLSAYFHISC